MFKLKTAILLTLPLLLSPAAMAQQAPSPAAGQHDFAAMHKEMCGEHYAREVSRLAYLQARLGLSEQQQTAFNKWRQAVTDQDAKEQTACLAATPNPQTPPTVLEREAHMEKMLTFELQKLQATKPALEAFYQTLSPDQKATFDRLAAHHHGFSHGPMGHGGMGHGPMSQGPMGHGGHGPMMQGAPDAPMPPQDGQ